MTTKTKDLTKQAPTSPRHRTGGYAILSRMTDKARADIAGKMGEYHTNCPLDHMLLNWKGVDTRACARRLRAVPATKKSPSISTLTARLRREKRSAHGPTAWTKQPC